MSVPKSALLGVEGDVRTLPADQGGGWQVGPADYSGAFTAVGRGKLLKLGLQASERFWEREQIYGGISFVGGNVGMGAATVWPGVLTIQKDITATNTAAFAILGAGVTPVTATGGAAQTMPGRASPSPQGRRAPLERVALGCSGVSRPGQSSVGRRRSDLFLM